MKPRLQCTTRNRKRLCVWVLRVPATASKEEYTEAHRSLEQASQTSSYQKNRYSKKIKGTHIRKKQATLFDTPLPPELLH